MWRLPSALLIIFIVSTQTVCSQTRIDGMVKDAGTNEPLLYCNISVKGTCKGTITNGEGKFTITANISKDTLLFSYVGYEPKQIAAGKLIQDRTVFLTGKDVSLEEVVVHAKDDYLYDIMDRCRRKLLKGQASHIARVYYGIETQTKEQPIEQLECYYNAYIKGTSVDKLLFKNGRVGLAILDERYFLSRNSSAAISRMNLTEKDDYCPVIPFQLSKRELKKNYHLEPELAGSSLYKIKFQPRNSQSHCFSGEAWIDKETLSLIKTDLWIENTSVYPFLPLFPCDSISHVDLNISHTYKQAGSEILPDHIDFSYHVTYKSVRDKPVAEIPSVITREINTKGLLYFYDYDNPFIIPYFEYDNDFDDYRKMSFIPYNAVFWSTNNPLRLTEEQELNLGFFSDKGHMINYGEKNYGRDFLKLPNNDSTLFEFYYVFWSPDKRIILNRKLAQNEIYPPEKINNNIQSSLYDLKVQILLDITQTDDSLHYKSYTVFDANKTFFHLPGQPYTNSFLNIYFDICEIERRKMEGEFKRKSMTSAQMESLYKEAVHAMEIKTTTYLREVQLGKNEKALSEWNSYVKKNLNIDNMALFTINSRKQTDVKAKAD